MSKSKTQVRKLSNTEIDLFVKGNQLKMENHQLKDQLNAVRNVLILYSITGSIDIKDAMNRIVELMDQPLDEK